MERDIVKRIEDLMDLFDEGEVTTADQIQRPEDPYRDFNERNPLAGGGRIGFGDGSVTAIKQGKNKGKFHLRLGSGKNRKTYIGTEEELNKIFENRRTAGGDTTIGLEKKKYKKNFLPRNKFLKFLKENNIKAESAANFAERYGIKREPNPFNKNQFIYSTEQFNDKFIEKIQKRQVKTGQATDFAKKKFPVKTKSELQKPRLKAIKAKGGIEKNDPFSAPRGSGAQLGHTGNIFGTELITGDRLAYTPSEVNELMSRKGNLDDKIRTVSAKIENIKKSNKPPKVKKDLLEQADNILIRLASQSQGFKKVTLSDGSTFGGDRLTIDPFDIYKGKTEKEIVQLQKQYLNKPIITEEMAAKNPNLKVTPPEEIAKIQDAYFFEENRKASLKAAQKFPKQELNNLLSELAANIDPDGCGRKKGATGGRIGLRFGSTACATKAKNYLNQVVDKGIQNEPPARVGLIKKIISGTGNFIKQGLSLKELLKLENLVGKPALYATAVVESGLLADDVLRKKEPINVAAAENFLVGNLLNLDADAERAKNIINDPNLSPAAKTYAQGIIDQDNFTKLSQTYATNLVNNPLFIPSGAKAKADIALANLKNKILNTPETGRMDYESSLADKQDAFTAKEKPFDAPDKPGLPSFTSGQLEKRNVPGEFVIDPSFPLPLQRETLVPSYVSPSYQNFQPILPLKEDVDKVFRDRGLMGQDEELTEDYFQTEFSQPAAFEQLMQLPSFRGASERFARGGIAGLSGGDKSGPPPERGPNPQGLLSLKNRVRNL